MGSKHEWQLVFVLPLNFVQQAVLIDDSQLNGWG